MPSPGTGITNVQPPPRPAEPGNRRAVSHGAYSDKLTDPIARELADRSFAAHPHLDPERDGPAVARYARLLARIEVAEAWLAEQDDALFSDREAGQVHALVERLDRWTGAAERAERALAIDPLTRARLGLTHAAAFDLAKLWAEQDRQGADVDGQAVDAGGSDA